MQLIMTQPQINQIQKMKKMFANKSTSPTKRPKSQRTQDEHNTTLMAFNNSELAQASDSASDYQSDNLENNCKKKRPLTMACAQYLDSPLFQNLVEMNKASYEMKGYVARQLANSLHIHGEYWHALSVKGVEDPGIIRCLLEGWTKI